MKKTDIGELFRRLAKKNPAPKSELNYGCPYTLLVAVVLSAQATDAGVNKATKELFKVADTPGKMLALGEQRLRDYVKTIGLYNSKAKNIIRLSEILVRQYDGKVPCNREALEALPGVGRKTANVVLNVAFGEPTIAVDTHVFRVANRTGIARGKTPLQVELKLESAVPDAYRQHAHHWLILHGRYVCKARVPDCKNCVIADLCAYSGKTLAPGASRAAAKKANIKVSAKSGSGAGGMKRATLASAGPKKHGLTKIASGKSAPRAKAPARLVSSARASAAGGRSVR
ncbi:MAG TPA: endonuclease III [Candidatus Cybelea sp.]|nr:endonuclease III [Candidatus Cybelea sp.]